MLQDVLAGRHRARSDWLGRLLEIDTHTYLVDDIFTKVDIASMQNSLEVRCPLIDHDLIEFAATLPAELKLQRLPRQATSCASALRGSAPPQDPVPDKARVRHPAGAVAARRAAAARCATCCSRRACTSAAPAAAGTSSGCSRSTTPARSTTASGCGASSVLELWHRTFIDAPRRRPRQEPPRERVGLGARARADPVQQLVVDHASIEDVILAGREAAVTCPLAARPISASRSSGVASAASSACTSGWWRNVGTSQPVSPGRTMPSTFAACDRIAGSPAAQPSSAAFASPS